MLRLCNIQAKSDHKILTEAMQLICFILCWRFSQSRFPGKWFFLQKESKFTVGLKFQQHEVQTELSLGNGTQVVPTPPF